MRTTPGRRHGRGRGWPRRAALPGGPSAGSRLKDALSGTGLQPPVRPPLTDVVIGSWLSGLAVDAFGGRDGAVASRRLVGLGILAALPTAATGASDWSDLIGKDRRLGSI